MARRQPPLRAAQAMAAYGRQMAQRTAWIACLGRGSRWLEPLLAPHHPLRPGPLLGTTLSVLTAEVDQPAEARPEQTRRPVRLPERRDEAARGRLSPAGEAAEVPVASHPEPRRGVSGLPGRWQADLQSPPGAARAVADLPRQAPSALLASFAGAAPNVVARRVPRPGPLGELAARMGRGWQAPVVERVKRVAAGGESRPVSRPSASLPAPIAAAWSTRLSGPTAPLSLLKRAANLAPASLRDERAPARPNGTAAASPSAAPQVAAQLPSVVPQAAAPSSPAPPARESWDAPLVTEEGVPFAPSLWGMLDYPIAASATALPPPDQETTVRVVNPTLAPRLPFLMPSEPGGPPDLPIAAATARQGAMAEAAAEEDLEALAVKLKRILNEEARRHGIGV
ncbi:MAG: hypothetical protein U0822_24145 [Anaerolineae bacterium]